MNAVAATEPSSFLYFVSRLLFWPLALIGAFALILCVMLATPLHAPPTLDFVNQGALAISGDGKPDLSRFQARDGTWLAYRLYPAKGGAKDQLAIVIHGSSGSSDQMNMVARALAEAGVAAVAIDARGHGASGTRGDIAHVGQLDEDMVDLIAALRGAYPTAKLILMGHSSGGGFALRFASGPDGALFDKYVLLAPYLGYAAPTTRPYDKGPRWTEVDMPRLIAIGILQRFGLDWPQALPVIAFANAPEAAKYVTSRYSSRLLADFGPPADWKSAFEKRAGQIEVIAGEKDEFMNVAVYQSALAPLGARVTLIPGVDHMGLAHQPAALETIVAATTAHAAQSAAN